MGTESNSSAATTWPADMPRITAAQMRSNWNGAIVVCPGCGAHICDNTGCAEHRPDCTVEPSALICENCDAIRLPSEPKTPAWRYNPRTRTYHCPTHQKEGTP